MHTKVPMALALCFIACAAQGAPTAAASAAREISRQERPSTADRTFLFLVVVVPPTFSSKDLKELGEAYRKQFAGRWQVEIDIWDSEAAFRQFAQWQKANVLYDETAVPERKYLGVLSHQRAKYRKNPKMSEHALTIYRKAKSIKDEPVGEVVKY